MYGLIFLSHKEALQLKYGLIGIGNWGQRVAKTLDDLGCLRAVSSSGNIENINKIKKIIPNAKVLALQQILESSDIDAVFVCVPHDKLCGIAKSALISGKHVVLEKPGAVCYQDLIDLEAIRLKTNKSCYVNYTHASSQIFKMIKEIIMSSKIDHMNLTWEKQGTFGNNIQLNLLTHDIAIIREFDTSDIIIHSKILDQDYIDINLSTDRIRNCHISIDRRCQKYVKKIEISTQTTRIEVLNNQLIHNEGKALLLNENQLRDHILNLNQKMPDSISNLTMAIKILQDMQKIRSA